MAQTDPIHAGEAMSVFVLLWTITSLRADDAAAKTCLLQLQSPKYPPLAMMARVQGTVEAKFSVDSDGRPSAVELTGNPLLTVAI